MLIAGADGHTLGALLDVVAEAPRKSGDHHRRRDEV